MQVSEVAAKFSIPRYHIDYWKKTGLISVLDDGQMTIDQIRRARFIWDCKLNQVTLKKIRKTLGALDREVQSVTGNETSSIQSLMIEGPGILVRKENEGIIQIDSGQLLLSGFFDTKNEKSLVDGGGIVVPFPGKERKKRSISEREEELKDLESRYLQAMSGASRKDIKKILEKIVNLDSTHLGALIELGNMEFEEGRDEKAVARYERAMELDPACVEALYNTANIYFRQGKLAAAIRNFEKCIQLDPEFPESYYNLGIVYFKLKQLDRAEYFFDQYMELDPDSFWSDQAAQYIDDMELLRAGNDIDELMLFDNSPPEFL